MVSMRSLLFSLAVLSLGIIGSACQETTKEAPKEAPPLQAPATAAVPPQAAAGAASEGRTLSSEQRQAMLEKLNQVDLTTEPGVWFATVPNNPEAAALQRTLQSVFEEAGWKVNGNAQVGFSLKPGIYFFAAEEQPPFYVGTALEALQAAGLEVTAGRGYRAFYDEKKAENPSWRGFDMAPEQTYVIVIGRKPEPQPAESQGNGGA